MKLTWSLYLLLAVFCLTSCNDVVESLTSSGEEESETSSAPKDDTDELEDQLKAEKEALKDRIDEIEDALEDEDKLVKKELEVVERLGELRKYSDKVEKTHADLEKALGGWRTATRGSFKGVKLPKIETIGGVVYSDVTITNVADDQLTIEHSGGMDTVEISQLTLDLRRNLIHEPTVTAERDL